MRCSATSVSRRQTERDCTKLGVCGKTPEIANLQDLLILSGKGDQLLRESADWKHGAHMDKDSGAVLLENVLFTTLNEREF